MGVTTVGGGVGDGVGGDSSRNHTISESNKEKGYNYDSDMYMY